MTFLTNGHAGEWILMLLRIIQQNHLNSREYMMMCDTSMMIVSEQNGEPVGCWIMPRNFRTRFLAE